jgi:hypothetical protein
MTAGGNTGAGLPGLSSWNASRPEEPDVRPTSPVLCELGEGNLPRLRDPRREELARASSGTSPGATCGARDAARTQASIEGDTPIDRIAPGGNLPGL